MRDEAAPFASEAGVIATLEKIPSLLDGDAELVRRGRLLNVDCLIGLPSAALHFSICGGRITSVERGPLLMRPWRFAYRASPMAFVEFWQPMPKPGWHDLLSLTKRGEATLEGDLHPFISHLQYFKDLLELPRGTFEGARSEI